MVSPKSTATLPQGGHMGQAGKRTRLNRTITVDFQNEATYFQLLGDGMAFVECVLAFLLSWAFSSHTRPRFTAVDA